MCASTVNYTEKNFSVATEKMTFECDKSISAAVTNFHKENQINDKWNDIGNHSLLYYFLFTVPGILYCMCLFGKYYWNSYSISYSLV